MRFIFACLIVCTLQPAPAFAQYMLPWRNQIDQRLKALEGQQAQRPANPVPLYPNPQPIAIHINPQPMPVVPNPQPLPIVANPQPAPVVPNPQVLPLHPNPQPLPPAQSMPGGNVPQIIGPSYQKFNQWKVAALWK